MLKEKDLTLTKIKIHKDMSQETNCFSADILLNGKKAGAVHNSGTGGSHVYYWDDIPARDAIEAFADGRKTEFNFDKLDQLIDDLLEMEHENKQLRRRCKTQLVYRVAGSGPRLWVTVKCADTPVNRAAETQHAKAPIIEWANDRFKPDVVV